MVTISIGAHSQAQGNLVRMNGTYAVINAGGRMIQGKLITPLHRLPSPSQGN